MFDTGSGLTTANDHTGYVAGRYRNGALSDAWTDVSRCAERTFTAYYPACSCGWTGRARPANVAGLHSAQHDLLHCHMRVHSATRCALGQDLPDPRQTGEASPRHNGPAHRTLETALQPRSDVPRQTLAVWAR